MIDTSTDTSTDTQGRVLQKVEAVEIARKVFNLTSSDVSTLFITHTALGITTVTNNLVRSGDDGDIVELTLRTDAGKIGYVSLQLNQLDDDTLRTAVNALEDMARQAGSPPPTPTSDVTKIKSRDFIPVSLWHNTTARASSETRHEALPPVVDTLSKSGLVGSAFIGTVARSRLIMLKEGLTAFEKETDSEITVGAYSNELSNNGVNSGNNRGSGWAGDASRDWTKLNPQAITERAVEMAKRAQDPVALEPGRRTAILSPEAVAQILRLMPYAFNHYTIINREESPLYKPYKKAKLRERIFDTRLNLSSNPADPEGGYMPFLDSGLPIGEQVWVENGILKEIEISPSVAGIFGRPYNSTGNAFRLTATPNTATSTVEEMIANCQEGIFVNRLSNLTVVDKKTCMINGVTKDGCFLVRNGKIEKSIKNFRFMDSPFFFFNSVEAVGPSKRCSLGYVPPRNPLDKSAPGNSQSWPLPPIVAPALMVRDFNFVSLADAV